MRKVVVKTNITETCFYLGDYEYFTKTVNGVLSEETETLHINAEKEKVALADNHISQITNLTTVRFQLTNHLGSASLELDETAEIITYEEYHPFGTSSYRSGSSETEVSLKRYKYVFKELDNETGLYYYGMRYYAAWIARFVSVADEAKGYKSAYNQREEDFKTDQYTYWKNEYLNIDKSNYSEEHIKDMYNKYAPTEVS